MKKDDFIGQQFYWFTGEIEDIDDPEGFNRVRVRCHGYHPPYKEFVSLPLFGTKSITGVKTEDLPWATVLMPATSAGTPGVGANHHLEEGSWVIGFFRDGASAQDPVVIGSITTSFLGIPDLHSSASITNKIYRSKAGHLIELQNEEGNESIKVTHGKKGAYIEIDSDGVINISSTTGAINVTTTESVNVTSSGDDVIVASGVGKKTKIV